MVMETYYKSSKFVDIKKKTQRKSTSCSLKTPKIDFHNHDCHVGTMIAGVRWLLGWYFLDLPCFVVHLRGDPAKSDQRQGRYYEIVKFGFDIFSAKWYFSIVMLKKKQKTLWCAWGDWLRIRPMRSWLATLGGWLSQSPQAQNFWFENLKSPRYVLSHMNSNSSNVFPLNRSKFEICFLLAIERVKFSIVSILANDRRIKSTAHLYNYSSRRF